MRRATCGLHTNESHASPDPPSTPPSPSAVCCATAQVLLWKNHIQRKRNLSTFCIEVLVPVIFTFALIGIANTVKARALLLLLLAPTLDPPAS